MSRVKDYIINIIRESGSISVDHFMSLISLHYYSLKQSVIGKSGDFITAPEISQMFGETLAAWFIANLEIVPDTNKIILIELGGGYGTLMRDILSVIKKFPKIDERLERIVMIEASDVMREKQRKSLQNYESKLEWYGTLDSLLNSDSYKGSYTKFVIANEFFDALPVKQFIFDKEDNKFYEIRIRYEESKGFYFFHDKINAFDATSFKFLAEMSIIHDGAIIEVPLVGNLTHEQIAGLMLSQNNSGSTVASKNYGLIIDYGYTELNFCSSLQAVFNHTKCASIFEYLGEADISTLVNFTSAAAIYKKHSLHTSVSTQGEFLLYNGIVSRAEALIKYGHDKDSILSQLNRLASNKGMGDLFKVLEVKSF